jgi:hypothetical protein
VGFAARPREFSQELFSSAPARPDAALALILIITAASIHHVSYRLKRILAIWFTLQIVLPFTAPLHTCDLADLFGVAHRAAPVAATTPMAASEAEANTDSFVSPIESSTLRAFTFVTNVSRFTLNGPLMASFEIPSSPQVLQTVVRV